MDSIIYALFILLLVVIGWYNYKKNLTTKYRYELYLLRDNLRNEVINGNIKKYDWSFDYLDCSISKTINELERLNIWATFLIPFFYSKDNKIIAFRKNIDIAKSKNEYFSKLYDDYGKLLFRYVTRKHTISLFFLLLSSIPVLGSIIISRRVVYKVSEIIGQLRNIPETAKVCTV